jgi:hypothetical protein
MGLFILSPIKRFEIRKKFGPIILTILLNYFELTFNKTYFKRLGIRKTISKSSCSYSSWQSIVFKFGFEHE